MSCALRRRIVPGLAIILAVTATTGVRAENDPAVLRGLTFLESKASSQGVGEAAMVALALIKSDVQPGNPALTTCVKKIRATFKSSNTYTPERQGGQDIYEAAVIAMALGNLDNEAYRGELQMLAQFLMSHQKANGSWDYDRRTAGDTSISQYALLGLWEAEAAGVAVPGEIWDRAAGWYMSAQSAEGSWNYHRDETGPLFPETISMTAAGVGSLLICQRQLSRYRKGGDGPSKLLTALAPEGSAANYVATTPSAKIDQAVKRGIAWIGANFTTQKNNQIIGQSVFYGLYGIERIGALADKDTLGRLDWFKLGRDFLVRSQGADGSWEWSHQSPEMNTAWAVLFLTKSTKKTIRRIEIKRLSAGTLIGNRGLPKDLSTMTFAGGKAVSRPMSGAVEGMLAVLEDPRAAEKSNEAVAGLVARYQDGGPAAIKPYKDRFLKMITERDADNRRVAAWALARMGDLDVVPKLIDALNDPDEEVIDTARMGLQILSRKINGFGPKREATPEERKAAMARWREWYNAIRPLDLEGQDDDAVGAITPAPASGSPSQ